MSIKNAEIIITTGYSQYGIGGIYSFTDLSIEKSEIDVKTGSTYKYNTAIASKEKMKIIDSRIKAETGTVDKYDGNDSGVIRAKSLELKNSELDVRSDYEGLMILDSITVDGGKITSYSKNTNAIELEHGKLTMTNSPIISAIGGGSAFKCHYDHEYISTYSNQDDVKVRVSETFEGDLEEYTWTDKSLTPLTDFYNPYKRVIITKEPDLPTYIIRFNLGGGTGNIPQTDIEHGTLFTLPTVDGIEAPEGKEFDAWEVGGKRKAPGDAIIVTADLEIKALWKNKKAEEKPSDKPTVDKTQLQDIIDKAEKEIAKTKVSTDGTDVPKNEYWVEKVDVNELQKAINDAKAIISKAGITQKEIDKTIADLNKAIKIFQGKKHTGRKDDHLIDPLFILWGPEHYSTTPTTPKPDNTLTTKTNLEARLIIGSKTLEKGLDGSTVEIQMDVAPYIVEGRTMVPIRFVAEALGFDVEWNEDTWTVIMKDKNNTVEIPVKTNKIIVNGYEYVSDVSPIIENDRTFLPIGNIARALGLKDGTDVIWNESTQEVIIKRTIENN